VNRKALISAAVLLTYISHAEARSTWTVDGSMARTFAGGAAISLYFDPSQCTKEALFSINGVENVNSIELVIDGARVVARDVIALREIAHMVIGDNTITLLQHGTSALIITDQGASPMSLEGSADAIKAAQANCISKIPVHDESVARTLQTENPQQASVPLTVGECSKTTVSHIGTRSRGLDGSPGSGTSIDFANGIFLVAYDTVPEAEASKPGDTVTICLASTKKDCPPDDDRGKFYTVINLRTEQSFTMSNSSHGCGGA